MTDATPSQQRRALIDSHRAVADKLLATETTHETLKDQVRLAIRDLDEGLHWLKQEDIDSRPAILKIASMTIDLAAWRLNMVQKALNTYGPGAMLIG